MNGWPIRSIRWPGGSRPKGAASNQFMLILFFLSNPHAHFVPGYQHASRHHNPETPLIQPATTARSFEADKPRHEQVAAYYDEGGHK
jgi:hypothetical protein